MSSSAASEKANPPSYEELTTLNLKLEQEKELYRHRYEELRAKLFGRSSEQRHVIDEKQELLFEEENSPSSAVAAEEDYDEIGPYQRKKKRSKKEIPADLPIDEVVHEPTETHCEACGEELREFARDTREEVEFEPARFFRKQYVTVHCSCPKCSSGVKSGVVPPEYQPVIPGTQVGASFLAHVMVSKYCDHLPYYRQSQMYERDGVFFADKTLSRYGMQIGALCEPVVKEMKRRALTLGYLHADETRIPVLDHEKSTNTHTGQLWVLRTNSSEEKPLVVYEYHKGRGKDSAKSFLGTYSGALQTDGLASYDDFTGVRLGCMAHARRYFVKAKKVAKKESAHVLKLIGQLYKIEADLKRELPRYQKKNKICEWLKKREKVRREKSLPILMKINDYLTLLKPKCLLAEHPLTKAVNYMRNRFFQFCVYVADGQFEIDNNPVEQSIRPVAIGRKNWMFAGSHCGAEMAAVMMSIVQTCKLRGINPHHYLRDVLPRLASHQTASLNGLTPMDWTPRK